MTDSDNVEQKDSLAAHLVPKIAPKKLAYIDLNADIGEGFSLDQQLMQYVSSVNIACGAHAGNTETITHAVQHARQQRIAIGAHPSFPDRENFGRKPLKISHNDLYNSLTAQLKTLSNICCQLNTKMTYVKPHGALYNIAATDKNTALCIIQATQDFSPTLKLMGLSGSCLTTIAKQNGCHVIEEGFADRAYNDNGLLVSRAIEGSVITDQSYALKQVQQLIEQQITSVNGKIINIAIDSICLHGDNQHALTFAKKIAQMLQQKSILIRAPT